MTFTLRGLLTAALAAGASVAYLLMQAAALPVV